MSFDEEAFWVAKTPLNVEVKTTTDYWGYLITKKHPVMKGKEDMVKAALQFPDEIRQSKKGCGVRSTLLTETKTTIEHRAWG